MSGRSFDKPKLSLFLFDKNVAVFVEWLHGLLLIADPLMKSV